jgi:predicted acylesterase/phospholipase RssA
MLGLAFEGCACRSAFHAGVAAALAEGGVAPAITAGSSSGSLCAAAVAAGRAAELPSIWRRLANRRIWSLRRVFWNRSIFDMSHLVRTALEETLGGVDLRQRPVEALAMATRVRDLRSIAYSSREEPDFIQPLLGSCFFPVFYGRTIRIRGELMLDGGLTDNLPVERLAARGCDEVVAVVTQPDGTALKRPGRRGWRPQAAGARVHVVHPLRPLRLGSWDLDGERMFHALDEGYAAGRAFVGA